MKIGKAKFTKHSVRHTSDVLRHMIQIKVEQGKLKFNCKSAKYAELMQRIRHIDQLAEKKRTLPLAKNLTLAFRQELVDSCLIDNAESRRAGTGDKTNCKCPTCYANEISGGQQWLPNAPLEKTRRLLLAFR